MYYALEGALVKRFKAFSTQPTLELHDPATTDDGD